jgi:hypothetical protein
MQNKLRMGLMVGLSLVSLSSLACPKGTTLVGGTGPYHKGGTCVTADKANSTPAPAVTDKATKSKGKKLPKAPAESATKTPNTDNSKIGTVTNPMK